MTLGFVILYLIVLYIIWVFYKFLEQFFDWLSKKQYTRNHFKLTERYRNEL